MDKQNLMKLMDIEKDEEINYLKTLEKKIALYEELITYGIISSLLSLLTFFVLFTLKAWYFNQISWLMILIPGLAMIIISTIVFNLYLRVEEIIDYLDKKNINIGTLLSYFCVNIVSISLIVYLILICLKLNKNINTQFSIISIPLYILLGISFFYFVFIFPALIQSRMYFEITVISNYLINLFFFLLMINYKCDSSKASIGYTSIFIPLWIAIGVHLLYVIYSNIINEMSYFKHFFFFCFVAGSLSATICLSLKLDSYSKIPDWTICLLSTVAFISLIIELFINYVKKSDDLDTKNQ